MKRYFVEDLNGTIEDSNNIIKWAELDTIFAVDCRFVDDFKDEYHDSEKVTIEI